MTRLFLRRDDASEVFASLQRLHRELRTLIDAQLDLARRAWDGGQPRSGVAWSTVAVLDSARAHVQAAIGMGHTAPATATVDAVRSEMIEALASADDVGRVLLARGLVCVETARSALGSANRRPTMLSLSSTFLRAMCLQLMPAERMALVGGSSGARQSLVTFDVTATHAASAVHVTADRTKMAQALTALEVSGARLLAWFHSHPGLGPGATAPSPIDTRQCAAWECDFPDLVAAIVTRDGHIRFFGRAVETGVVVVRVTGPDVQKVNRHVYRLG